MDKKKTDELTRILEKTSGRKELEGYLDRLPDESVGTGPIDYFLSLPGPRTLTVKDLVLKSGIERSYLYQILNGRRTPSREKVLRLCIGAGLSLEETQRVLELGKLGVLYSRDRRDAVLIFAIRSGLDTTETDDLLDQFGEALLG
ncbi:MAG: helix-turn-helix transcriptional regulator [Lachnospiraceae bacterium]|nr:helix-turn-helix transcriptional regulator [Lachnospiraceae bacterium]